MSNCVDRTVENPDDRHHSYQKQTTRSSFEPVLKNSYDTKCAELSPLECDTFPAEADKSERKLSTRWRKSISCWDDEFLLKNRSDGFHGDINISEDVSTHLYEVVPEHERVEVLLQRGRRGLGFSVERGTGYWCRYARVKRVFPYEPADQSGLVFPGDVILRVNQLTISDLSLLDTLNVLRLAGSEVLLTLARLAPDFPDGLPPLPPGRSSQTSPAPASLASSVTDTDRRPEIRVDLIASGSSSISASASTLGSFSSSCLARDLATVSGNLSASASTTAVLNNLVNSALDEWRHLAAETDNIDCEQIPQAGRILSSSSANLMSRNGLFRVSMQKLNGSLGLSVLKTVDSRPGHRVAAKLRPPALHEQRIAVGDRLLMVNGVNVSRMSHSVLVRFIRGCEDRISMILYRDRRSIRSSLNYPHSPSTLHKRLRPEAINMLRAVAMRRHCISPGDSEKPAKSGEKQVKSGENRAAGARRRVAGRRPHQPSSHLSPHHHHLHPHRRQSSRARSRRSNKLKNKRHSSAKTAVNQCVTMETATSSSHLHSAAPTPERALFPGQDGGWLSDPGSDAESQTVDSDSELQERHLQRLLCSSPSAPSVEGNLVSGVPSRDSAVYLSVQPAQRTKSGERLKRISSEEHVDTAAAELSTGVTSDSLTRWQHECDLTDAVTSLTDQTNQSAMSQLREIQLRRGWSARLGFSVQTVEGAHIVSHIHPESVAARDGRLRLGDTLVQVNGESLDELTSDQVIDLLRKTRAIVTLHVIQRY